jgi:hypothetical protein
MVRISKLLLTFIFLAGCATTPAIDPKDIQPAPQMAQDFQKELGKVISSSHCSVIGCINLISDSNHFICTGEFSMIISSMAEDKFRIAAAKVLHDKMRIDFTAGEGFGSKMLGAFLGGAGSSPAAINVTFSGTN